MRLYSVSVDMDEIDCYLKVHGVSSAQSHAVYDVALGRIRAFAAAHSLSLTLFVVARDLDRDVNVRALREVVSEGHEIGNHSLDHLYDLTRRDGREQAQQIDAANLKIHAALGTQPKGFRAPGYTVSDRLLGAVRDCGMSYDSSVFPCPPYYGAKAAVLLGMALRRRATSSVLDTPRVLRAPTGPYRLGVPYWTRGDGLLELPIQVAGRLRLPFIGTTLTLLGPAGAKLLTLAVAGLPFINLELHGLDFLDSGDVPHGLVATQPDLRVPLQRKLDALAAVMETLRQSAYSAVRLDEAARIFS